MATFIPLPHQFLARLDGIDEEELRSDPALAVHALAAVTRRYRWPIAVSHWHPGFEAELLAGAAGQLPSGPKLSAVPPLSIYIDVVKGLRAVCGPGVRVATTVTGPRTLAPLVPLVGGRLDAFYAEVIRLFAEAGASDLLIVETSSTAPDESVGRRQRSIVRAARYFGLASFALDLADEPRCAPEDADHVFGIGTATSVKPDALLSQPADTTQLLRGAEVVTTAGQIPAHAPPDTVGAWSERIAGAPSLSPAAGG